MDRNRRRTRNYYQNNYYTRKNNRKKATVATTVVFLCIALCVPMFMQLYKEANNLVTVQSEQNNDYNRNIEDINGEYFDYEKNSELNPDELDEKNFGEFYKKDVAPEKKPKNAGEIVSVQYSYKKGGTYLSTTGKGLIKNSTELSNSKVRNIISTKSNVNIKTDTEEPQVLIYHTHTSETYEKFDLGYFDPKTPTRTFDENENTVAVGNAITTKLNNAGIKTIHDRTIHDKDYTAAYSLSRKTVQKYLKKHPSIQVILDVHRDAIQTAKGTRYKPTTTINGKKAAQVMIITGCDGYDIDIPNYKDNLRFANGLQDKMESLYPTLTRPVLFDYRFYNQDLGKAAILLEMGGHANTLTEAIYSGELVGESLVQLLAG